jgi:hypothetical protein
MASFCPIEGLKEVYFYIRSAMAREGRNAWGRRGTETVKRPSEPTRASDKGENGSRGAGPTLTRPEEWIRLGEIESVV